MAQVLKEMFSNILGRLRSFNMGAFYQANNGNEVLGEAKVESVVYEERGFNAESFDGASPPGVPRDTGPQTNGMEINQ